jgi:hypothetical protein
MKRKDLAKIAGVKKASSNNSSLLKKHLTARAGVD